MQVTDFDFILLGVTAIFAFIGLVRGVSGEIGSILKITLTVAMGYSILDLVGKNANPELLNNVFFPTIIYIVTYILISILAKFLIYPVIYFLCAILPIIIDKPLGLIFGTAKILIIYVIIYNIYTSISGVLRISPPESFYDSQSYVYLEQLNDIVIPLFPEIENLEEKTKEKQEETLDKFLEDPESNGFTGNKLESLKKNYESL